MRKWKKKKKKHVTCMGKMCVVVINSKLCTRSEKMRNVWVGQFSKQVKKETRLHACEEGDKEEKENKEVGCVGLSIWIKLGVFERHVLAAF